MEAIKDVERDHFIGIKNKKRLMDYCSSVCYLSKNNNVIT